MRPRVFLFGAVFALPLLASFACSRNSAPTQPADGGAAPAVAVSQELVAVDASKSTRPRSASERVSGFSTAKDGMLDECTDVVLDYTEASDADAATDLSAYLQRDGGVLSTIRKQLMKGGTVMKKTCAEQFADRTALASCQIDVKWAGDGGASSVRHITSHYYNFGKLSTGEDDMKQCLSSGGDWKAVARDSAEWRAAKLEQRRSAIGKMLDEVPSAD